MLVVKRRFRLHVDQPSRRCDTRHVPESALAALFATSFGVGFTGALMPGPLTTLAVRETMRRGFWAGYSSPTVPSGGAAGAQGQRGGALRPRWRAGHLLDSSWALHWDDFSPLNSLVQPDNDRGDHHQRAYQSEKHSYHRHPAEVSQHREVGEDERREPRRDC